MDKNKQYQNLFHQTLKAYPQKTKQVAQTICNELWTKIKSKEMSYEQVIKDLKTKDRTWPM